MYGMADINEFAEMTKEEAERQLHYLGYVKSQTEIDGAAAELYTLLNTPSIPDYRGEPQKNPCNIDYFYTDIKTIPHSDAYHVIAFQRNQWIDLANGLDEQGKRIMAYGKCQDIDCHFEYLPVRIESGWPNGDCVFIYNEDRVYHRIGDKIYLDNRYVDVESLLEFAEEQLPPDEFACLDPPRSTTINAFHRVEQVSGSPSYIPQREVDYDEDTGLAIDPGLPTWNDYGIEPPITITHVWPGGEYMYEFQSLVYVVYYVEYEGYDQKCFMGRDSASMRRAFDYIQNTRYPNITPLS